ncbi:NAD(P)/FAD-dependent oxidoreductase [Fictibacillus sp. 5RED26]|uniref:phytoene desaturase family protein n=1 Tax=Fictibacillus sp. 5RED26 TaxID=2745876 RepID=UPI0018CD7E22|nr:FAD-dependent oxidoreductase [Fictibacillus sp. 5RED26]MBH0155213.1 NAD(P)/FAD-dependent oxidoreductase [Fictibacillus sp. 5RED26]
MNTFDVAIVGGGIAGLTSAVYLAQAGKSVLVLEKASKIGGRAQTTSKNGALFNLGGHALYRGGAAEKILNELEVEISGAVPDTTGYAIWNGELFKLPGSLGAMVKSKLLKWSSKTELVRVMLKLQRIDATSIPHMSLREWAEKEIKNPMVRNVVYALCRTSTYGIDYDQQLASAVIQQVKLGLKGVLYVNNGWQSIVENLRSKALSAGVMILTNKMVSSIEYGTRHQLFCADGETIEVSNVILTTGPEQSMKLMKHSEGTLLQKWSQQARPVYAACLDVALKKLPRSRHHFAIGVDQHILFSNHSRACSLSQDGEIVIQMIKYLGTKKEESGKVHKQELESILDLMQPGWRKELVSQQFLPKMIVVQDMINVQDKQYFGPCVPEIPGLYIAGDGAGHGEMLVDAAFASAKRAAKAIIQNEGLNRLRREA